MAALWLYTVGSSWFSGEDGKKGAIAPGQLADLAMLSEDYFSVRRPSAWAPLRRPLFRALWVATIFSNIGTWMHDVGASWLMTTLAPSPLMVALVQAATSLPVFS